MTEDYYKVLGVGKEFTPEELKQAKRRAARSAHPDRGGDHKQMVVINKAYATLSDPKLREYYDLKGEDAPRTPPFDTQAVQLLWNIMLQLSDQVEDDFDFIDALRQNMTNNRATMQRKAPALKQARAKAQKQMKTIRHKKGGNNLLVQVFAQKIAALTEQIEVEIPKAIKLADRALEILEEYEYTGKGPPRYAGGPLSGEIMRHFRGVMKP